MKFTNLHDGVANYDQAFALINRGYAPEDRSAGQYFETTQEIYDYFQNVLPPLGLTADGFSMSEFSTDTLTDAYLRHNGRFFCLCIRRERAVDFTNAVRDFRTDFAYRAMEARRAG